MIHLATWVASAIFLGFVGLIIVAPVIDSVDQRLCEATALGPVLVYRRRCKQQVRGKFLAPVVKRACRVTEAVESDDRRYHHCCRYQRQRA